LTTPPSPTPTLFPYTTLFRSPFKFEAGTTDIAGAIGLGAAADYLTKLGLQNVRDHDREITKYALEALGRVKDLKIYGPTDAETRDRKSTRLNSSHVAISYAVF